MIKKIFKAALVPSAIFAFWPAAVSAGVLYPTPNVDVPTPTVDTVGVSRRTISRSSTAAARDFNPLGSGDVDFKGYQYHRNRTARARRGETPAQKEYKRKLAQYEYRLALLEAKRKKSGPFARRSSGANAGAELSEQQSVQLEKHNARQSAAVNYQQRAQAAAKSYFAAQAPATAGSDAPGAVQNAKTEQNAVEAKTVDSGPGKLPQQGYRLPGTPVVGNSLSSPGAGGGQEGRSTFWTRLSSVFSTEEK